MTVRGAPGAPSLSGLILTLVPVLACLGSAVSVAGPVSGFRIAAALLLIVAMLQWQEGPSLRGLRGLTLLLCYVWTVVAVALLLTRGVNEYAWSELASLTAGSALLIAIVTLADASASVGALVNGWLIAYAVTMFFAARELLWGETFLNYYFPDHVDPIGAGYGIASTFGNPNAYAFFLVISMPVFVVGLTKPSSPWKRTAFILALLTMPILIGGTESRTGILLAVVVAAALALYLLRIRSVTLLGVSSFIAVASSALLVLSIAFSLLRGRAGILNSLDSAVGSVLSEASLVVRWMLVRNGIDFALDTRLGGLGPGGFEAEMSLNKPRFDTMGIINPHNGFIEILSQYGALVFVIFTAFLLFIAFAGVRAMRSGASRRQATEGFAAATLVMALPFLVTMNSSFLEPSLTWLLLGLLLTLGLSVAQRPSNHSLEHEEDGGVSVPGPTGLDGAWRRR